MSLSYYNEIDEFLGGRELRYFGDGYLKTTQKLINFKLSNADDGIDFTCVGSIAVPEVWSAKAGGNETPHLSTIDVLEFSLNVLSTILQKTFRKYELPAGLLKRIDIVAGSTPIEDSLDSIPIQGHIHRIDAMNDVIDLQIANMSVSITFEAEHHFSTSLSIGSKLPITINGVMLNKHDMSACAIVRSESMNTDEAWPISGCFAAALQLGQVLLYKLDDITRAESNTLWMKKTSISFSPNTPAFNMTQPIYTRLNNVKRYTKVDGDWRRADIFCIFCNTTIICSVTHRLPDSIQ